MLNESGNLKEKIFNQMEAEAATNKTLSNFDEVKAFNCPKTGNNIIHLLMLYIIKRRDDIQFNDREAVSPFHFFFDYPKIINHKNKAGHTPLVMTLLSDDFTNIHQWQAHEQWQSMERMQYLKYYFISLIQSGADISEVKKFPKAQELLTTLLRGNGFEMQLTQSLMLQAYMSVPVSEFEHYDQFFALDKMVCKKLTSKNNELLEPIKHIISPWLRNPKIVAMHGDIKYVRDLAFKARENFMPQERRFDAYEYAASLSIEAVMWSNIISYFLDDAHFVKCKMLKESKIRQYLLRDLKRAGVSYIVNLCLWATYGNNFLYFQEPKYAIEIFLDILSLYSKKDIEQNRDTLLNLSKHLINKYNKNQNTIEFLELYSHLCKIYIADPNATRIFNTYVAHNTIEPIIFAAIENDNYTILENLLKGGANINVKNRRNKTVLYAALELIQFRNQEQITKIEDNVAKKVELLLEYEADLDLIGPLKDASSPYIFCIKKGAYDVAEVIASCENVDINRMIKTINGLFSANLIEACKIGDVKGIEILLKNGADPSIQDSNGKTVFDFNITREVEDMLFKYIPAEKKKVAIIL